MCVCVEVRVGHGKVAYLSGLEWSQGHFVWDNIQILISCQVKHIRQPGLFLLHNSATQVTVSVFISSILWVFAWGWVCVCVCVCVCVWVCVWPSIPVCMVCFWSNRDHSCWPVWFQLTLVNYTQSLKLHPIHCVCECVCVCVCVCVCLCVFVCVGFFIVDVTSQSCTRCHSWLGWMKSNCFCVFVI